MVLLKKLLTLLLVLLIPLQLYCASPVLKAAAQSPLDSTYSFAGGVTQCQLNATAKDLLVSGAIQSGIVPQITAVSAYVVQIYEDETGLDFSTRTPFYTQTSGISQSFSIDVPLSQLNDPDSPYGVVFSSKVAVVVTKSDGTRQLVDFAKYISNPGVTSPNQTPFPTKKSVKGVGLLIPSDLEQLGVQYTSINVCLWAMMTLTSHGSSSITYNFEGQTYYFIKDYISMLDNTLSTCWANGIAMYAILIMNNSMNTDTDSPGRYLAHPDGGPSTGLVAVNMTDATGIRYYKAIMSFLSTRYDGQHGYGRFDGYIVGNEIGASTCFNCMGNKTLNDYVEQYARWLRLTNTIAKQGWANARVYASFDHLWTLLAMTDSNFVAYKNKDLIDALAQVSRLQGDFDWNITWHPYPQDIFNPATWNDANATTGFNTQYITFKNLEVLSNYMQQSANLYNGSMRHIILSEEGFNSGNNSFANQQLQAAAYAYAYYKVLCTPGIDMFSMNGHIDNTQEMGLSLGLWTAKSGSFNHPDQKKQIYDVFQYIDTTDTLKVSQFALAIIGTSMKKNITSWSQLIAGFDEKTVLAKCSRPPLRYAQSQLPSGYTSTAVLAKNSLAGWSTSDNTSQLTLQMDPVQGSVAKSTVVGNLYDTDIPKDYKGLTFSPAAPLDLTATPVISADVKVNGIGTGKQADFILRAYSGDNVMESAIYTGTAETWNTVYINLTGWSGLSSVDRIKVWVRPHDDINLLSGSVFVNNLVGYASSAAKDYNMSGQAVNIGSFEGGSTDNWVSGDNTNFSCSVTTGYDGVQVPPAASQGSYFLDARKTPMIATTPSFVTKTFAQPLNLQGYRSLGFDFNGYGGVGSNYMVYLTLTAADGTSTTMSQAYQANSPSWASYSFDISGFAGRDNLQSVSIGYAAVTTTYTLNWNGWFAVDNVNFQPDGGAGGDPSVPSYTISVATLPVKTTYTVGQTLDTTGMTLLQRFSNGTTKTITGGWTASCSTDTPGSKTAAVSYAGASTSFTVTVQPKALGSISVLRQPNKTTYLEGTLFDSTGMTLQLNYTDGTNQIVSDGWTATYDFSAPGNRSVLISYYGKSAYVFVTVTAKSVVSIAVATLPARMSYLEGTPFDSRGMSLTANYNNDTSNTVVAGFTVSVNLGSPGQQTATVFYGGQSASFSVTVIAKSVSGIALMSLPFKTLYQPGESFDPTGAMLAVNYNNGSQSAVPVAAGMVRGFSSSSAGAELLTVSYGGCGAVFSVLVLPFSRQLSSAVYAVDTVRGNIHRVPVGTTVQKFQSGFAQGPYLQVYTQNGTACGSSALVATGMTAKLVYNGVTLQTMQVVVTGDVNGDGRMNAADRLRISLSLTGMTRLQGVFAQAADLNGDGRITSVDVRLTGGARIVAW